jgi:hypothetical protein
MKLPIGSGAVESLIRQVIKLRLKGNGKFWLPENAEIILHGRCPPSTFSAVAVEVDWNPRAFLPRRMSTSICACFLVFWRSAFEEKS